MRMTPQRVEILDERIPLRCAVHNETVSLLEAIRQGWALCRVCQKFLCRECILAMYEWSQGDGIDLECPNSAELEPHRPQLLILPSIEKIIELKGGNEREWEAKARRIRSIRIKTREVTTILM